MNNVTIDIYYVSVGAKVLQGGTFPTKGQKPEEIAFKFWSEIKREMFNPDLIKVIANGEDITDKVKVIESQHP